jgi:hypothetical protein
MLLLRRAALPLLLGAFGLLWAAAHALMHDLVAPSAGAHGAGHAGTLEAYAGYLPTSLALCLVLATAIATGLAVGKRWTGVSGPALWLFGLVPVLGFVADSLAGPPHGSITGAAIELLPVVVIGLLLQLPFALGAVGLGSTILLLAERLARAFGASVAASRAPGPAATVALGYDRIPTPVLAGVDRSRAPPAAHRS